LIERNAEIVMKLCITLAALALLCAPLRAGDWYVDAQNGNDANNGQSPGTAWKTLTHAVATLPSSPSQQQLIHAAPGVYGVANGEAYPLVMKPGLRIVGDQGSAATILESPIAILFSFESQQMTTGYSFDATSGADGLTLRNSAGGISCKSNWSLVSPSFHDIVIQDISGAGVTLLTYGFPGPTAHPTFDHTTVIHSNTGFYVTASGSSSSSFGHSIIDLTDCVVRDGVGDGIYLDAEHGTAQATLVRCRITGNGGNGVFGNGGFESGFFVDASATLIASNALDGVGGSGPDSNSGENVALTDCTVANNGGAGVRAIQGAHFFTQTTLDNCILFGNGDDLAVTGTLSASYCDSGDGDLNSLVGCFAADPLFVNASDFRLRFGSPCIDVGNPSANGKVDLLGHSRPFDGDLDTQARPDMGAFEFEPLHQFGSTSIGHAFGLEFWGATGSMSQLFLSKQPITPPQLTPFGDFYLAPGTVIALGSVPAKPGPPFFLRRTIPNNASLIGTTFSFQALTDSALAPQGQAYTNPTSFVVTP
jgi:hypothetical protein